MSRTVDVEKMEADWLALLRPFAVDKQRAQAVFADLVKRYSEDGRFYHNLRHIQNVLTVTECFKEDAQDFAAVQFAVWFHDVIYDMTPSEDGLNNEERSARYAGKMLGHLQIPPETIAKVKQLILATQIEQSPPDEIDYHILLDADLATLASSQEQYNEYARAIRQEFSFVPDDVYRLGRKQVLDSFLQRQRIFFTSHMYNRLEESARENIQQEIDYLLHEV